MDTDQNLYFFIHFIYRVVEKPKAPMKPVKSYSSGGQYRNVKQTPVQSVQPQHKPYQARPLNTNRNNGSQQAGGYHGEGKPVQRQPHHGSYEVDGEVKSISMQYSQRHEPRKLLDDPQSTSTLKSELSDSKPVSWGSSGTKGVNNNLQKSPPHSPRRTKDTEKQHVISQESKPNDIMDDGGLINKSFEESPTHAVYNERTKNRKEDAKNDTRGRERKNRDHSRGREYGRDGGRDHSRGRDGGRDHSRGRNGKLATQ